MFIFALLCSACVGLLFFLCFFFLSLLSLSLLTHSFYCDVYMSLACQDVSWISGFGNFNCHDIVVKNIDSGFLRGKTINLNSYLFLI